MFYSIFADLVLVIHLLFIVFVVLGALLVFRWPRVIWAHIPAVTWGALVEFNHWLCPLTPLEIQLREAAMEQGYEGDFVGQYLIPIIYPPGLTPEVQWVLGAFVVAINGVLYGVVWHKKRAGKR